MTLRGSLHEHLVIEAEETEGTETFQVAEPPQPEARLCMGLKYSPPLAGVRTITSKRRQDLSLNEPDVEGAK